VFQSQFPVVAREVAKYAEIHSQSAKVVRRRGVYSICIVRKLWALSEKKNWRAGLQGEVTEGGVGQPFFADSGAVIGGDRR